MECDVCNWICFFVFVFPFIQGCDGKETNKKSMNEYLKLP